MSNNANNLFSSRTDPIPGIRRDLQIIPVQDNGHSYLYFHDMLGYATPNFALNQQVGTVLSLLDGRKSIEALTPYLGEGAPPEQLLEFIQFLDKNRLLDSPHFRVHAREVEERYEQEAIHKASTAGLSYPADPEDLRVYLDEAFNRFQPSQDEETIPKHPAKALYAPHIDPRVGLESYVKAFSQLKNIKPKRVVILATSHYAGLYPETYKDRPFIISKKDFEMPLRTIRTDRETVKSLLENSPAYGLSGSDRAHRIEHSIEMHLLFLSYLWDHDFEIIPVLVGGFEELLYMNNGYLGQQLKAFNSELNRRFADDDETFFLISGDLAHVGKKFGDDRPAMEFIKKVQLFDEAFIQQASQGQTKEMLKLMAEKYDPYRICGFPPLYTFLEAFPGLKGTVLSYNTWDEQERESAVTFGSILFG